MRGVADSAIDKSRSAVAQPWESDEVESGDHGNPVPMSRPAAFGQLQTFYPTEVSRESCAPDDSVDTLLGQVY